MSGPVAKPGILSIRPYAPGKAKGAGIAHPIKLSANENALGCSAAARAAYREAEADLHLYPDPQASALREALAAKHAIEPGRILFGTGSDEIFSMLCQAYLNPGDNIVQPRHGFAAWAIAARAAGGEVKSAPERDYTADVDAVLAAVDDRTRLVFIANPANPTGTCLPAMEIARLHANLPSHVVLVLDAAYAEYAPETYKTATWLGRARDAPNLVVTHTFSKLYGLAALRIGWAYGPPEIVDAINRFRLPYNTTRPAQAAAIAVLGDGEFVKRTIAFTNAGRASLTTALTRLGLRPVRSSTNFVTGVFPEGLPLTAAETERRLAERGIFVRSLVDYGLPDCLRITIGAESDMARLVAELETILS